MESTAIETLRVWVMAYIAEYTNKNDVCRMTATGVEVRNYPALKTWIAMFRPDLL